MKEGVISRFNDMQFLLQNLLKKDRQFARGSEYVIAVPTDVTEVEKKAVEDATYQAGAREVAIIEEPVAAAIGAGIDIGKACGNMIVDIRRRYFGYRSHFSGWFCCEHFRENCRR